MLDHNIGQLQFCPSIMSFRRKWVSDTNLSKLLHETLEKKQANKQSKLPDFCKDAILSATIKKISSAMVINKSLPNAGKDEQTMKDCPNPFFFDPDLPDEELWGREAGGPATMNIDSFEIDGNILTDKDSNSLSEWRSSRPALHSQSHCASPKRKRHPSSEGTEPISLTNLDAVASHASPRKKRRENSTFNEDFAHDTNDFARFSSCNWSEEDMQMTYSPNNHIKGQRSQSLPHLTSFLSKDGLLVTSQTNFSSPKSVVNSISELSIDDCWEPTTEGSWCFPRGENVEPDPLELNGFFQELKSVTVHPN